MQNPFFCIFACSFNNLLIMKVYKWLRGLLKVSAFTTVMFIMQACYGTPQQYKDPVDNEEADSSLVTNNQQVDQQADQQTNQQTTVEGEAN